MKMILQYRKYGFLSVVSISLFAALVLSMSKRQTILYAAPSKESEPAPPPVQQKAEKQPEKTPLGEADEYELQRILVDTIDQVERNYVKGISRRELVEAAIEGVLEKLDPYSTYISPEEIERFRSEVESEFCGVGIKIDVDEGELVVISPLVGSPAHEAGILAGDCIVAIDGQSTDGINIDDAVRRLKGKEGSEVTLSVLHADEDKPVEIKVKRRRIHLETVLGDGRGADNVWNYMLDKERGIGYVRVTIFGRDTAEELRAVLEKLQQQGLKAFVLDLRFNPGGLLSAAVEVSDLFVSDGLIVSTSGRNVEEKKWEAKKEGTFSGFPMAVLVNRVTASAGEIVAACLQDHKRAVVMGERTWGKGSVQNVISLEHGLSALKLTTAAYCRPSGKNIHRYPDSSDKDEWGVTPDDGFAVETTSGDMMAMARERSRRDIVAAVKPAADDEIKAKAKAEAEEKAETDADGRADRLLKMALAYLAAELNGENKRADAFRLQDDDVSTITLYEGARPVLAYNYGEITGKEVPAGDCRNKRAAYVHPLWGLDGEILSDDFPIDHYHHHGLFWTWPHVSIDGKNYDLWMGCDISQKFVRWIERKCEADSAVLEVENGWFVGERKVMDERVRLQVYRADKDSQAIDVKLTLTPLDHDVSLLGAEGKSYGGLTLRFAIGAKNPPAITVPDGLAKDDLYITRLPWADLTASFAKTPGGKETVRGGAAIFVSPDHPDYPPTWLTRHYGVLCVGWPGVESKTFPAGKPFTLSYRIWIHKGDADAKRLDAAYKEYRDKKK